MSDKESKAAPSKEDSLDELLNSALEDFDKANTESTNASEDTASGGVVGAEVWNEEFIAQQAKIFEERMSAVFGGVEGSPSSDQINVTFQKMAEAAALAVQGVDKDASIPAEPQLADSLTEALKALKEGSGLLQEAIPPEGLAGMFSGLQLDEEGAENPFMPVMQGMMQSLLSAEVLLPSLKELLEKYPAWMDQNADKISASDKERYTKQQELFKVICAELEKEKPDDSATVKNERFKIVLKKMQKLHDYGQPPSDLIGDPTGGSIPTFDPSALNDPSACSVM